MLGPRWKGLGLWPVPHWLVPVVSKAHTLPSLPRAGLQSASWRWAGLVAFMSSHHQAHGIQNQQQCAPGQLAELPCGPPAIQLGHLASGVASSECCQERNAFSHALAGPREGVRGAALC